MKLWFRILILPAFWMILSTAAIAAQSDDVDHAPGKEPEERVRKRIETLRLWKLTNALDLDEKTSAQLFPVLGRFEKRRAAAAAELRSDMRDLRESLRERRDGRLKTLLDRLDQDHRALQKINDEERAELKKILTLEQQARYILFQQEFEKEIRKAIAEARDRRQGPPGTFRPEGGPFMRD